MQALWMLVAVLMFSWMGALVKLANAEASLGQILFFRGLPSALLLVLWAQTHGMSLRPLSWRMHGFRNLSGVGSMSFSFYAIGHLPLGTAVTLNYTAPLFIAGWLLFTQPRPDFWRVLAVLLGFLGIVAVLRPAFSMDQWLPATLGLISGACLASALLQVKTLSQAGEQEWRIVLYFSVSIMLAGLLLMLLEGWTALSALTWLLLLGIGLCGLVGQFALTRAFGQGSPWLCAVLQYVNIPLSVGLGYWLWADRPDGLAWAGMGVIIMAGLLSTLRTLYMKPR
ncbi:MAG: DMT family transporter [Pigmentiphaga sp.]|nr:DMT family transporter [Pigmentiphaga sp.]